MDGIIDLDKIKNDITLGQIIPIIGDEVLYIVNESGDKVSLQNYILQKLNEKHGQHIQEYSFKNMAVFERLYDDRRDFNQTIYEFINGQEIEIDPRVLCFLKNGAFPLIITTTCTDALERVLSGYVSVYYYCNSRNDIGAIATEDDYERLVNKTIFHLFGRLDKGGLTSCVISEDDFLKYLHGLSDTRTAPPNLQQYIQNKNVRRREILALGCNIPDWVFRFLLYSMVKEGLFANKGKSFKGGVIDSANDANLAAFLKNIAYYYGSNILGFIEDINARLQPQKRHSIFVSVFSKDLNNTIYGDRIHQIIYELKKKYDIWFCEEQLKGYAGEDYWGKIQKGLEECEFFLPIITNKVLSLMPKVYNDEKPTDDRGDQGVINEWKYALEAWKDHHSYFDSKPYVLPYLFGVEMEELKEAFKIPDNKGVEALSRLILGEKGKGIQNIDSVDKIDLDKLLEQ